MGSTSGEQRMSEAAASSRQQDTDADATATSASEDSAGEGNITVITPSMIDTRDKVEALWANMHRNYYVSFCWELDFYIELAYHGFVSVAHEQGKGYPPLLVPEIQKSYGTLAFEDLHVGRTLRRRARKTPYSLTVNNNLDAVFRGIERHHDSSWLIAPYRALLHASLRNGPTPIAASPSASCFHAISVELNSPKGEVVAGEVGYIIGRTYTSLTGFYSKEPVFRMAGSSTTPPEPGTVVMIEGLLKRTDLNGFVGLVSDRKCASGRVVVQCGTEDDDCPEYLSVKSQNLRCKGPPLHSSAGKIQLVALGKLLAACGVECWNLGHPPRPPTADNPGAMQYKSEIGGSVLSRENFLTQWIEARDKHLDCITVPTDPRSALELIET